MNRPNAEIGLRVRRAREALGLTRKDLVEDLEHSGLAMNLKTLQRIENGERSLAATDLLPLAAALAVEPVDLLPGGDSMTDADLDRAKVAVRRVTAHTEDLRVAVRVLRAARQEAVEAIATARLAANHDWQVDLIEELDTALRAETERAIEAESWVTQ